MTKLISYLIILISVVGASCSFKSEQRINGWYEIKDHDGKDFIGHLVAPVSDFKTVAIEKHCIETDNENTTIYLLQGKIKDDKLDQWADETERLIGHRLGFVYNDSIITAPQINCRIESGNFQINSQDSALIYEIHNSIATRIEISH